ncbi:MAG: phytoene desaturase family protein [Spirochaetales bacterium]
MQHVVVIGSGFGGISAAAYLAQAGYRVTVYEKNSWVGGRARVLHRDGFHIDMGPSWYWMPEEHDRWFSDLGAKREDYYQIHRVDPSYKVFYGESEPSEERNVVTVPADFAQAKAVFESYEPGAGAKLEAFVEQARKKYEFAMSGFIYRNFYSPFDMVNGTLVKNIARLNLFKSYRALINSYFTHPYLKKILEFPVVFLGSYAERTPAVYTLMNYIDFGLGTWYPDGGFGRVVESMKEVAEKAGAQFVFNTEVTGIRRAGRDAHSVYLRSGCDEDEVRADVIVANADYVHVESDLLQERDRSMPEAKWKKRTFAPAVLNYYVGVDHKLPKLEHHTFFFDTDWDDHFDSVYGKARRWARDPLFYIHIPSKTDPNAAPEGQEVMFILIPTALGLEDGPELRKHYFDMAIERIERLSGESIRDSIVFQESMSISEFKEDYNAHDGTAFGLGQTLFQTAYFRPMNRSKKVPNLYYTGHYTVPGTGTTMSMISGKLAAMRITREYPTEGAGKPIGSGWGG